MRIAVTIIKSTWRVSPLFESAELVLVRDCCRGHVESEEELVLPAELTEKLEVICGAGVQALICGAIANETVTLLQQRGVVVYPFVAGEWRNVLADWRWHRHVRECHIMPGCGQHHRRCCGRQ